MPFSQKNLLILSLLFFLVATEGTFAQQNKGKIRGTILDQSSSEPLPFSTIGVFTERDSLVGGGISDENGKYSVDLPFGKFYALIEFMGFESKKTNVFTVSKDDQNVDLGTIELSVTAADLNEVVVQGEKTVMELSLDKRIFNVGKDLANAGGNASDILMNLPSVAVDPDG